MGIIWRPSAGLNGTACFAYRPATRRAISSHFGPFVSPFPIRPASYTLAGRRVLAGLWIVAWLPARHLSLVLVLRIHTAASSQRPERANNNTSRRRPRACDSSPGAKTAPFCLAAGVIQLAANCLPMDRISSLVTPAKSLGDEGVRDSGAQCDAVLQTVRLVHTSSFSF